MATAYVNIGSNLGDRHANIMRAVALISTQIAPVRISAPIESEPWGFDSANTFINVGVTFDTDLPPLRLLHRLQAIERSICTDSHRTASGGYADRIIDIDLILLGTITIDTPELTLPHPRMHQRPFVMIPLRQLLPDHPEAI